MKKNANLPALIFMFALLIVWQCIAMGMNAAYILPSPTQVLVRLWELRKPLFTAHLPATMLCTGVGLAISIALGLLLAIVMDASPSAEKMLYPLIVASQTIPTTALAPLFVLWFGYTIWSKVLVTVLITFFPIAMTVFDGFRSAKTDMVDMLKTFGAGKKEIFLKLKIPAGVNDAMSMVAAGKADIGLYYQQDVIQARAEQNVPIKSIGAVVQGPLNIILSLKDKNITKPQDLEGKTVGYAGTELSEALVRSIMQSNGADPNSVNMVDVGFDLMSSMTTGNVDATIGCLVNHEVPQMEKEGFEVNYFFPDDYGVPKYYEGIFLASDDMIANNSDTLKGFLRACSKGFEDFKSNTNDVLQVLLDNQDEANFALDPDVEKKSCETLLPLMETEDAKFLSQTEQCWQENIDWMYDQGLIAEKPDVSDVMVNLDF